MILNARDLEPGAILECDICIAGAGAAGITLAVELSNSKLNVIILESGGLELEEEVQSLYQGRVLDRFYPETDTSRLRFFGGTTNHWAGACSPLSDIDFERRDWLPHSGWPFTRADLDPFYLRAQTYCQLGPYDYSSEFWQKSRGQSRLALDAKLVETAMIQLSPPVRFGETYRDELSLSHNIRVFLYANLVDINLRNDGNAVEYISASVLNGGRFKVKARRFVLAMGGTENPRMLLNADSVHTNGVGNRYDLVGRYYMDHPVAGSAMFLSSGTKTDFGLYLPSEENKSWSSSGRFISTHGYLKLSEAVLRQQKLLNIKAPLIPVTRYYASLGVDALHQLSNAISEGRVPDELASSLVNIVMDFDMVIEGVARKSFGAKLFDSAEEGGFYLCDSMMEQRPEPGNRIRLDNARDPLGLRRVVVEWRLSDADKENHWKAMEIIAREFGRAGVGRVRLEGERNGRTFGELLSYGYHHMGTTRAHENPRQGVVDASLKVHGVANLYVAGSSVFPTGGHVPPTLTIVALAIRLADHLRHEMERA